MIETTQDPSGDNFTLGNRCFSRKKVMFRESLTPIDLAETSPN
jgi:hypothetical protein